MKGVGLGALLLGASFLLREDQKQEQFPQVCETRRN